MKPLSALAVLLALVVVPGRADEPDKVAALRGEIVLLELRLDADKSLLREAMLMEGRGQMKPMADPLNAEEAKKQANAEMATLKKFIEAKGVAVVKSIVELKSKATELAALEKAATVQRVSRPNQPVKPSDDKERQGLIEKLEEAQVEVQLLQMQTQLYQEPLNETLQALANSEFAASNDPTQRDKADAARKNFDKARKQYVEFSKRLQLEQSKVGNLQMRLGMGGMGGMGGGMGGMGGGFR